MVVSNKNLLFQVSIFKDMLVSGRVPFHQHHWDLTECYKSCGDFIIDIHLLGKI